MQINILKLEQSFEAFKVFIKKVSGQEFTSFDNKYIDEQENYKKLVYNNATEILSIESWKESDVGTGKIIDLLQKSIDQKQNNLLEHTNRRGENARSDKLLLEAKRDTVLLVKLEKVLFDFYTNKVSDEESFNSIMELAGKVYPFLAFLFFIKSNRKYLPIAPETFDSIFEELNINYRTSHKCSWDNYINFIGIIREVRNYLLSKEEIIDEVNLLDAHSFLWILARQMKRSGEEILKIETHKKQLFQLVETRPEKRQLQPWEPIVPFIKRAEDFERDNQRKRISGKESEEIVFDYEVNYLVGQGREDLSKKVVIKSDEMGLGYDILSFDKDGNEKHIEVKTHCYDNYFWLTKNELEVSKGDSRYFIYVVDKKTAKILDLKFNSIAQDFTLEPQMYKVHF